MNPKSSNPKSDITKKFGMLACGLAFTGIMLFFTYSNSNKQNLNEDASIKAAELEKSDSTSTIASSIKSVSPPIVQKNPIHSLESDFAKKSKESVFHDYYQGLIGNSDIKDTILYPTELLKGKLNTSPLDTPLPQQSSLLEGFPFTTFGDATLNINNPLNTPLIAKLIFHDESDQNNYAVRHFYIAPNSSFKLTGLLQGVYQVAGMSASTSEFAFVTQLFNVYDRVEGGNNVDMLGKQIKSTDVF